MLRLLLIALVVLSPACKKANERHEEATQGASRPTSNRPITSLGDVVATLQMPSGTEPADLVKLVDQFQPGVSAMLRMQLPTLMGQIVGVELTEADLKGPVSIVVLNPERFESPAVLLLKVSKSDDLAARAKKAGKLTKSKQGLTLLGEAKALAAAESFAFDHLSVPSTRVLGTVYPSPLVATYQKRFDAFTSEMEATMSQAGGQQGPMMGFIMDMYKEMFSAMGAQTDRLVVSVGTEGGASEVYLQIYAKPGTTMAAFIQAQVPAQHELLGLLPQNSAGAVLFSGDMRAGAARDAMFDYSMRWMSQLYATEMGEELKKAMLAWMTAFDGRFSATVDMDMSGPVPSFKMNYLMGSSNVDAMRQGWRRFMGAFAASSKGAKALAGMEFDISFQEKAHSYDGVEIDLYSSSVDMASMNPSMAALGQPTIEQKMHLATFDNLAAMTMADEGNAAIESVIDAARGKGPRFTPPAALADALALSKKRKESMLMLFDVKALVKETAAAPPFGTMAMGMGKDESGALNLRFSIAP